MRDTEQPGNPKKVAALSSSERQKGEGSIETPRQTLTTCAYLIR